MVNSIWHNVCYLNKEEIRVLVVSNKINGQEGERERAEQPLSHPNISAIVRHVGLHREFVLCSTTTHTSAQRGHIAQLYNNRGAQPESFAEGFDFAWELFRGFLL